MAVAVCWTGGSLRQSSIQGMQSVFTVIMLIACGGCGLQEKDIIDNVFGNAESFDLMRSASEVLAYRLSHKEAGQRYVPATEYEAGASLTVSRKQVDRLRAILASPQSYTLGAKKSCGEPIYGVRIRFKEGDAALDVNLCFKCDDLELTRDGETVGAADFHRVEKDLIAISKELFPDDDEIQSLRSRH